MIESDAEGGVRITVGCNQLVIEAEACRRAVAGGPLVVPYLYAGMNALTVLYDADVREAAGALLAGDPMTAINVIVPMAIWNISQSSRANEYGQIKVMRTLKQRRNRAIMYKFDCN